MSKIPQHTRPKPSEWSDLATYAERVIPAELEPDQNAGRQSVYELHRSTRALSEQQLEECYYYAEGELMTGMSVLLRDEPTRRFVVQKAAEGLLEGALRRRGGAIPRWEPFAPVVGDLNPEAARAPFMALAMAARHLVPAPQRVLGDVLASAVTYRRQAASRRPKARLFPSSLLAAESARGERPAAQQAGRNALEGAMSVLVTLLTKIPFNEEIPKERHAWPICAAQLDRIRSSGIFTSSARLRLDEFKSGVGWHGSSGYELRFDSDILRTPPPPLPHPAIAGHLHEERLKCPAVQAGGLARMIARDVLPEIIVTASQITPGDYVVERKLD